MKKYKIILTAIMASLALTVFAQTGGNFDINKSTIDSGGGPSSGGNYSVSGSIGQADASENISGGAFTLTGGFWSSEQNLDIIFKNGFE